MFNKLKENIGNLGGSALESKLGDIQELVKEHVGPMATELANDDVKMTEAMKKIYTILPMPVRLAVKQDKFVEFCFSP